MPGNSHENKQKNSLFVAPRHFNRPTANLEGDKALALPLSSQLKALQKTFLSCHMGDGLIDSLLGRPTSQAVPPVLRSVQVPDNPPKNMWNSHYDCKSWSAAMDTNGSLAIWLQSMWFWLLLQSVSWWHELFQNSGVFLAKITLKGGKGEELSFFLGMALPLTKLC